VLLVLAYPAAAWSGDVRMVSHDVPLGPRALQSAAAPIHFNMLGLRWRGPGAVQFRTRSVAGRWSAWRVADADTGPDRGSPEARHPGWHDGNPSWTGAALGVQFRTRGDVSRLRAYYLWSRPRPGPVRSLALAGSPLVVPRSGWHADEKITRQHPYYAPTLKLAVVHHTAGTNNYTRAQAAAIVRGIEVFHVKGNGWNDIGYNFLVDRFGTVYEGRAGGTERNVIGAHALGFNTGTVGVALIGNGSVAAPTPAQRAALVKLLAWRLDVAHVDPLSSVADTSAGNAKFRAGKVVTLRAISGHRDTGPSECPGSKVYALLPAIAKQVARTGTPKLYSPVTIGVLGGKIRFQARLSSTLPWTVTVSNAAGRTIARGSGRSSVVDWSWSSAGAGKGPFTWTIAAGPTVLPARGTLGVKPSATPVTPAVPATPVTPAPVIPTTPVVPAANGIVSGLSVSPTTVTPGADGAGTFVVAGFVLSAPAFVTATVAPSTGGPSVLTLLSGGVSAGQSSFKWDLGALRDGRYRLTVSAQGSGGSTGTQTAEIAVDRTLGSFTVSAPAFSPNGDGVSDTVTFSILLGQPVPVQMLVQRNGATVATVWSAQVAPGLQVVSWDGTANGVRLPDGDYVAVVTANGPYGAVSLLRPVTIDTTPPSLTLVDGPSLRFSLSEPASLSLVVNGQAVASNQPAGSIAVPFTGGAVTSFTAQARDAAGNATAVVSWP
jgi:hypothetical protein